MSTKQCKDCKEIKDIDEFEKTTKDGKCRRAVCKPCYSQKKTQRAKEASKTHTPENVPKPEACVECGKGVPEVNFKWRADTVGGGWRSVCITCINGKGYTEKYRAKKMEEDAEGFRKHLAEAHLKWAHANPDKVKAQQKKMRTDPDRKFKALITYVKAKYGEEEFMDKVDMKDAEKLQAKMSEECHYCGHKPREGDALNGLDRVDCKGRYDDNNTVSCCGVCNSMKLTFTSDEVIEGIRNIVSYRGVVPNAHEVPRPKALGGTKERREATKDKRCDLPIDVQIELWSCSCHLCGRSPALGIDRIDSTKKYTIDNCMACCSLCNYMKKDSTTDEFLAQVTRMYNKTALWVIGDTSNTLNVVTGPRKPVSVLDASGDPLLIFPSIATAGTLIGTTPHKLTDAIREGYKCAGHNWRMTEVKEYKKQIIDQSDTINVLKKLRGHKVGGAI